MPANLKQNALPDQDVFLKGILVHNPVLVQAIGICPVVAAAVSLRAAALLAGIYTLILIITELVASAFLKKTVRWVRVAIYMLLGLAIISPFSYLLEKHDAGIRITVGIYLSLLAANSLAVLRCEKIAVKSSVKNTFYDSLAASMGYSMVLLFVGFVRELLGSATIFERPIGFLPKSPGLLMPFGGFIILGFMAAALRALIIRRYPQYAKAMMIQITPTPVTLKIPVESDLANGDDPGDKTSDDTAEAPMVNTTNEPETEPEEDVIVQNTAPPSGDAPEAGDIPHETEETDDQIERAPNAPDNNNAAPDEATKAEPLPAPAQESLPEEPLRDNTPQNQTPVSKIGGDNVLIDEKIQQLLDFLNECDAASKGTGSTDS